MLEILNEEENDDAAAFMLTTDYRRCANFFWFGVIMSKGYMWFNGSLSNVTYRNFDRANMYPNRTDANTVIFIDNNNKAKWRTARLSYWYCTICQIGECCVFRCCFRSQLIVL